MACALLSLGSNLGQSARLLQQAQEELVRRGLGVARASRPWRTRAVGGPPEQGEFLNQALLVETSLPPRRLLQALQQIEQALGRVRQRRWAARTIDIDLLLYEQHMLHSPELQLPHPRMSFRRFVLHPAVEVAGEMVHPVAGRSLRQLLDHLDRTAPVVWIAEEGLWHHVDAALGKQHSPGVGNRLSHPPVEKNVPLGSLRLERLGTLEQYSAFCRRWEEASSCEAWTTWGVWVGKQFPPSEALPRLVVAGAIGSGGRNGGELLHRWQQAVRHVGPHLVCLFAGAEHLLEELEAALLATQPATIRGPCGP